ncbi:hypothetical protein [Kiritimatiella glycovorans]|uniref:hypothetical protein n=1 Tax=Kiritimatiella glycovorans TaxID=1307763 RepID=UPI00069C3898|nr:hypothetical protein [Kiritimatiella glycovorans]
MSDKEEILDGFCLDPGEFFKDSDSCTIHAEVMEHVRKERSEQFVDPRQVRDNQDWSFLADKVVGSELQPTA